MVLWTNLATNNVTRTQVSVLDPRDLDMDGNVGYLDTLFWSKIMKKFYIIASQVRHLNM